MDLNKFDSLWYQMHETFMSTVPEWAVLAWEDYDALMMAWDGL